MTFAMADDRAALDALRAAQHTWDDQALRTALSALAAPDALFRLSHPFGDMIGPDAFLANALAPLKAAWPDLERRDWIVATGNDQNGATWIGFAGHFFGTFKAPFLGIPATGKPTHMRFHEFYRLKGGKIVEMQAIWDVPEVMMQAGAWPMAPSLGRELFVPGPSTCDGLARAPRDPAASDACKDIVVDMLAHMIRHPSQGGPEVMEMPRFWHPNMNWYGPAGIGTCRGIEAFRNWHQIPFLNAMPDRGQHEDEITHHFFGDAPYVAVTGWPNMMQTLSGDGWLGIAPSGKKISLRSLDFWRIEDGRIRENWVLVDLLDVYRQLGVDVLARMAEMTGAQRGVTAA